MYRPQQKSTWREREAERKRMAEEEERKKKIEVTEENFPTFVADNRVEKAVSGSKYASLAQNWADHEESERRIQEYRRNRKESERRQFESFYSIRSSRRSDYDRGSRYEDYEEEDTFSPAVGAGQGGSQVEDEDAGWTEVKRKTRKPKRDLSIAEMEHRERERQSDEDNDEFNADLYESDRHEHYKV